MQAYVSLLLQAGFFVSGVYIEKTIRKSFFTREDSKRIKMTSRIVACAIATLVIMMANYELTCSEGESWIDCFYLRLHFPQLLHVLFANTLLFSTHIWFKFLKEQPDYSRYNIKSVFVAPLLEEVLFRASFYRTGSTTVPVFVMALIFSLSHLHKPVRKFLKGKLPNWKGAIGQVIFTLVFGLYSFYFLGVFGSVLPSILLHCYCNFLGPPSINKSNIILHSISILLVVLYCWFLI